MSDTISWGILCKRNQKGGDVRRPCLRLLQQPLFEVILKGGGGVQGRVVWCGTTTPPPPCPPPSGAELLIGAKGVTSPFTIHHKWGEMGGNRGGRGGIPYPGPQRPTKLTAGVEFGCS